jgi:hypothetical protein
MNDLTAPEWLAMFIVGLMTLSVLYGYIAPVIKDERDRRRPKPAYAAIAGPPFSVTGSLRLNGLDDLDDDLVAEVAAPAVAEVKLRATPRSRRSPLAERL